ncbi:hypothetical protein CTT31_23350 [Pseudoalteromonas maricaloris]|nr:hypothetical protein CTT31_23350 [Pseudoalteromonas flavipulchra]
MNYWHNYSAKLYLRSQTRGVFVAVTSVKKAKNVQTFIPKMSNFEISAKYEGLSFKKESVSKSIADLKAKYAR